nr:membrane-spanning 4-domains subfamily A member 7 isoform X5 [Aotus nancymaae]
MLLQSQTMRAFDIFTPKGITIPEREKPGHMYQKEDYLQSGLPKEATVLGTVQILCCLMISSLGVILVFASYPSRFNSVISTTLMSGYPFLGALCFGVTGSLSIISGKQSTKPFGVLVVMLIFTVLELLFAAYSSVFWWKQLYSNNPGVSVLTCHIISAVSQVQATIIQAQKSGKRKNQLLFMRCMWKATFIIYKMCLNKWSPS